MATETTYHEVRTANTTYTVRRTTDRYISGEERTEQTFFGGRPGIFTVKGSELPRRGCPVFGTTATGRVQTSPVVSVRRISFKAFAAARG